MVDGKLFFNIFSEVRADEHARIKKPVAKYFSPAGVAPLEPHIDAVITTLCRRIDEDFASDDDAGQVFDFSKWSLYCMLRSLMRMRRDCKLTVDSLLGYSR